MKSCKVCEHPGHGLVDEILARHLDLPTTGEDLALAINATLQSHNPQWQELTVAEVTAHRMACDIVLSPQPSLYIEHNAVMLPGGQKADVVRPDDALKSIVAIGMRNILTSPESVSAAQTLKALELLTKIADRDDEMADVKKKLAEIMLDKTPGTHGGPYAEARPVVDIEKLQ